MEFGVMILQTTSVNMKNSNNHNTQAVYNDTHSNGAINYCTIQKKSHNSNNVHG